MGNGMVVIKSTGLGSSLLVPNSLCDLEQGDYALKASVITSVFLTPDSSFGYDGLMRAQGTLSNTHRRYA